MKKNLYFSIAILFLTVLLSGITYAQPQVTVSQRLPNDTVYPGRSQKVGEFTLSVKNGSAALTDVVTYQLPLNSSFSNKKLTINATCPSSPCEFQNKSTSLFVSVPEGFTPGIYPARSQFVFENRSSISKNYQIKVLEKRAWNITDKKVYDNFSVGNSGKIGEVTFQNSGNVRTDIQVSVSGNISDFLSFNDRFTIYPSISRNFVFEAQVPKNTDFGIYNGKLIFKNNNKNRTLNLSVDFLDEINPEIKSTSFNDFMATKPPEFVIEATDNLEIDRVTGKITYKDTVVRGNKSVEVTKTLEKANFSKENNTDNWKYKVNNSDRIGSYDIRGGVFDESGNKVNYSDSFEITGLNVTEVKETASLPRYKQGETQEYEIAELSQDTNVFFTLKEFDQPLDSNNETWKIGIIKPNGNKDYFRELESEIEVESKGDVDLFVYSDKSEKFSGEIKVEGLPQHVEIPDITFEGEFVDYEVPEDKEFDIANVHYILDARKSKRYEDSGWEMCANISSDMIPKGSSLEESMSLAIPQKYKETQKLAFEDQIEDLKSGIGFRNSVITVILVIVAVGLIVSIYFVRYNPYHYFVKRKEAK